MISTVIILFLAVALALLLPRPQRACQQWLDRHPSWIVALPLVLSTVFAAALAISGAFSVRLTLLVLAYTLLPVGLLWHHVARPPRRPEWRDLAAMLLLWLPLELSVGRGLVPRALYGTVHAVAYGVAVLLALFLFLFHRRLDGMKYRLPVRPSDFLMPLIGLAILTPVLIVVARILAFIEPFHVPAGITAWEVARRFGFILAATALPEEILFRSLIQNWLMQRFGFNNKVLLVAAVIFGAAHLNNGPGSLPNWRYMILATIAGYGYGKVFQKSGSVLSSTAVHAAVNTLRHSFF